tara:strand:+ start:60 stop:944 length:885 start_codon:yes stop_codon:yes gene_type:complete
MFLKFFVIYFGLSNIFNNTEYINNHNKKENITYLLEQNYFINNTYINESNINNKNGIILNYNTLDNLDILTNEAPLKIDWRDDNIISAVKNQEKCGSCWSFSSAEATEGIWAKKHNNLYNLSEQELIDCSTLYGNNGCSGGSMINAYKYIINNGLCTNESYPYTGTDKNICKNTTCNKVAKIDNYKSIISTEKQLEKAVALQPVSVAIEADKRSFQLYKSGIYNDINCGQKLDHGVLLVGYGYDFLFNMKYWIVKNSWGEKWGENGYIRIQKDSGIDGGMCGIALQASAPIIYF